MSHPYLEVTYRKGKPFAAYLYLDRRPGDKCARTERHGDMLADVSGDGRLMGIEFTHIGPVDLQMLNDVLQRSHQATINASDLAPLTAA